MVSSAEVMQELLHLFSKRPASAALQQALNALRGLADEIYPVEAEDVDRAHAVWRAHSGLSSRDALHVAVMQRRGVSRILSYDRDFDRIATIERVY